MRIPFFSLVALAAVAHGGQPVNLALRLSQSELLDQALSARRSAIQDDPLSGLSVSPRWNPFGTKDKTPALRCMSKIVNCHARSSATWDGSPEVNIIVDTDGGATAGWVSYRYTGVKRGNIQRNARRRV
jgi:hypothetical protein